ncbi:hypothetical protein LSH36_823g00051 [Paralvinella palmiformis]|uniref:Uncharacterized protein n=1 Tax=Paralvinella palmiformis TaxID=53620 RepID=A0AAD9IZW2_9ANNE|nr:hypothetical protein LSH36_823g00051 [Paralvinella palmiformis]
MSDSDIVPKVRYDNYDTCAVFTPFLSFPWFYDFSIPVYYRNASGVVAVELVGDNIGCSLGNDAKFFIFPVSTWSDATGLFGLRSTCILYEAAVVEGTSLQKLVPSTTAASYNIHVLLSPNRPVASLHVDTGKMKNLASFPREHPMLSPTSSTATTPDAFR